MSVSLDKPIIPADLSSLDGDAWQALADDVHAYEESIQTPAQKTFHRLVQQNRDGLLTDTDLWAEVVMLVSKALDEDDALPPVPTQEPVTWRNF